METKVRICDDCKRRVKAFNCEFCDKDLCKECSDKITIHVLGEIIGELVVCKKCLKNTREIVIVNESKNKEKGFGELTNSRIKEFVLGELKKLKITETLAKG